jgi:hypothetical protein
MVIHLPLYLESVNSFLLSYSYASRGGDITLSELLQPGKGKKEISSEFALYGEDIFRVFNTLVIIKVIWIYLTRTSHKKYRYRTFLIHGPVCDTNANLISLEEYHNPVAILG